jgi:proteic killer suppression protein
MITDFACEETSKIFDGTVSKKFPPEIQNTARRKLRMLDAAINFNDLLQPPGNRLEKMKEPGREGQFSIRINDQWRICFTWSEGNAREVKIEDYH